jgi:hypothetical protein
MGGLGEGCKDPYSHQTGCIIRPCLVGLLHRIQELFGAVLCQTG